MNALLGMRLGRVSGALALALIGGAAACSSSSSPPPSSSNDAGPTDAATSSDAELAIDGPGAPCPVLTQEWVGALFTLNVTWAGVEAASGGSGKIYLWTLNNYMISGNTITGTSRTCGTQIPPLVLNATGIMAEGLPSTLTNVSVLNEYPTKLVWDNDTRTAATTGTLGGWNIGSSIAINPTTSVSGLTPTSMFADPTTPWPGPGLGMNIPATDLSDDDMDGNPGVTLYPLNDNTAGYYLPATELGGTPSNPAPHADKLYAVSRTQVTLYGTSISCSESTGTLTVPQFDEHIIGCHDLGTGACTGAAPAAPCAQSGEWEFIDQNATIFAGAGGKGTLITGTFDSKQMDSEGGTPSCDDVIALFPSPMPQPQGDE
jgi:hypothetical protein